jgi:hypothetical protein
MEINVRDEKEGEDISCYEVGCEGGRFACDVKKVGTFDKARGEMH